ncbi:alpha/beta hydrolase [Amycolatopsis anabasis]|uniref:alpha/beta hydrolase n=1 Tax=Amycolatopsis anabasis TaxID=1840409 RepID=UPI00131EC300|nr:alpha/beta hydrolase [Amycolatopsis anabasis]
MTTRGNEQSWVLDLGLRSGGFDALHPEGAGAFHNLGYDAGDFDRVFSRVRSAPMQPKAFARVAAETRERAEHYEKEGFGATAYAFYLRSALLWSRAQYAYFADDARKAMLRERCNAAVAKLSELGGGRIERVVLDFEGQHLFALLHLPAGQPRNAPAVILGPGMDMTKEDFLLAGQRHYAERGYVALAVDMPGEGESLSHGLKATLTNPERAVSRFVDFLAARPEVDAGRIGFFGCSMSTYWGMRAAAHEPRLRAVAGFMGVYGDFETIFNRAQPNFKTNFMYMSGYTDEEAFDADLGTRMNLWELAGRIACPVLMGIGEFDELTRLEEALALYELIRAPKEIRVYEDQFHPLGGVANEMYTYGAEWLRRALAGEFDTGRDARYYVHHDGGVTAGSADPVWWQGARPAEIAERVRAHQP